jgi:hypothetical protein
MQVINPVISVASVIRSFLFQADCLRLYEALIVSDLFCLRSVLRKEREEEEGSRCMCQVTI